MSEKVSAVTEDGRELSWTAEGGFAGDGMLVRRAARDVGNAERFCLATQWFTANAETPRDAAAVVVHTVGPTSRQTAGPSPHWDELPDDALEGVVY